MAMTVNTNVSSLAAQRSLAGSTQAMGVSMARLSSGLRINSAKDDAAGLAISSKMTNQIRGMNQAVRNSNDGISMAQTAEGAMGEVTSSLQRIRELAVQAASGTNSASDRTALNSEAAALLAEITSIAANTTFNGIQLLDGTVASADIQAGSESGQTITVTLTDSTVATLGIAALDISTVAGASAAIGLTDTALDSINTGRAGLGASQARMESTINRLTVTSENLMAARSRIVDADFAQETANMTRNNILQQAGTSILAQANQQPELALQLLG